MATDPKLEGYLTALDKALSKISVSERADILTEIKSHILDAQARNPEQTMATLLAAMGEPEAVANRYLLERGLKPHKHGRTSIAKWLTIGFLGSFGIACATFLLIIWNFSPLISVDEKTDRVRLLGGLIDVNGESGSVKIGDGNLTFDTESSRFAGDHELTAETKEIQIPFSNGKFVISSSTDGKVHWDCKIAGANNKAMASEANGVFMLNFEKTIGTKCEIQLPSMKSVMKGANGKVEVDKPQASLDIIMANGKVEIEQDKGKLYKFDLSVANGKIDQFTSSEDPTAIGIKVNLGNGKITREATDEE